MVKTWPAQMEPLLTVMVGVVSTVMVAVAVLAETQPRELLPVTV
jgi:hypothetical protein